MMQESLRTIGEAIIEDEFDTEYEAFYTASPISGGSKSIESVVVVRFERIYDRVEYIDTKLIKPESNPEATAKKHGYANSSGFTDNSLTKRASESQPIGEKLSNLFDRWFNENILGDELFAHPLITGVHNVSKSTGGKRDRIERDVDNIAQRVEYRALLTVSVIEDGEEQYAGEIDVFNEGLKRWMMEDLRSKSSAKDSYGFARCSVCDEKTECFGLGAKMGEQYTLRQQWPFPEYNSSEAWRGRPLCVDCIVAIDVASDRFLEPQDFGPIGIRCRTIPYALPVPGATEQLKNLIRDSRRFLSNPDDYTGDDDQMSKEDVRERPLAAAWRRYRQDIDNDVKSDLLRLAFSHVVRDSTKTHGIAWIDGVSFDQIDKIREDVENFIRNGVVFKQNLLPRPDPPSEREIFSGMWLFNILTDISGRNSRGEYIGDSTPWADYTERLLTRGTIRYSELVSLIVRESRARYRERLGENTYYPYDVYHLASAYTFIRIAGAQGILNDEQTKQDTMTINTLDGTYTSFGDGVREFVTAHPSIANSPGRTAAFALGTVAAQLSNWQRYRGLSRTFLQTRDIDQLTTRTLVRWQTDIWKKAKIYNSQSGNNDVPWSEVETIFHEAILAGENGDWKTTTDELRYHYILGANIGPKISQRAQSNRENRDDISNENTDNFGVHFASAETKSADTDSERSRSESNQ